jgi:hypothetical protein
VVIFIMDLIFEILESIFPFRNMNVEENYMGQFSKIVSYKSVPIFRTVILTLPSTSGSSLSL